MGNCCGGTTDKKDEELTNEAKKQQQTNNKEPVEDISDKKNDIIDDDNNADNNDNNNLTTIAIRKEIRSMSKKEQDRFFNAVKKMMENKNGAGTSEFFRCASYHGQPGPIYCQHGRETFPGWHRIYLMDFELALKKADKQLGNDGNIGLPYWDWMTNPNDGLPQVARDNFEWNNDLFPKNISNPPRLRRASNNRIANDILSYEVKKSANDSLLNTQHWAHASTGFENRTPYPSIETPHNYMHVIVGGNGGPMGSVAWAAYDIAFWLHHCNVDRIYEKYIQMETDSRDEMESFQDTQPNDLFEEPYTPFKKSDGTSYYPKDAFGTEHLGYKYDKLPDEPKNELREAPTLCVFENVEVSKFESKCYQIHVYVIDKDNEDDFKEPGTYDEIDSSNINYGGAAGIFGRGMECENCMTRPPMNILIDITETLKNLKISRYNAKLRVLLLETTSESGELIDVSESQLPKPYITGPLFEDKTESLTQQEKDTINADEVKQLQNYLIQHGYYDDELDGDFGPITEQAVKDLQTATGTLKVDGIAGKNTKKKILDSKRCSNKDGFAKNDVKDENCENCNYDEKETEITFSIDYIPGYLNKNNTISCISQAFNVWDKVSGLTFKKVDKDAQIKVTFNQIPLANNAKKFDRFGGVLGHGGKGFVTFDIAERWVVDHETIDETLTSDMTDQKGWYRGQPKISLYYTAVHEIGHALGLDHSVNSEDIMSPWYNPKNRELSDNDAKRIAELHGEPK